MNPQPRSCEELHEMSDAELLEYFMENSRYRAESPEPYSIRFGSRSLFSTDTADLREKFFRAVRDFTPRNSEDPSLQIL